MDWRSIFAFRGDRRRGAGEARNLPASGLVWPADKVLQELRNRYGSVEPLGQEGGASMYGVVEGEVRFAVVLVSVAGRPEAVAEVGFVALFRGYTITDAAAEALNRNLHISFFAFDGPENAYLVGGVSTSGDFSPATFQLVLDAWRRDLAVALFAISGAVDASSFMPGVGNRELRAFAVNDAKRLAPGKAGLAAATFFGARAGSLAICRVCDGRGRTGLVARTCDVCDGIGLAFDATRGEDGASRR